MTTSTPVSSDPVNGTRTLELGEALYWLKEHLASQLKDGRTEISTVGSRTKDEQNVLGILQILVVMYPLAIELALKSLKGHLHAKGEYEHIHKLDKLFSSLAIGARDTNDAMIAKKEARDEWEKYQKNDDVNYTGTLDEFLKDHSTDFVEVRYYDWANLNKAPLNDFLCCLFSILAPLVARDPDTKANFEMLVRDQGADS